MNIEFFLVTTTSWKIGIFRHKMSSRANRGSHRKMICFNFATCFIQNSFGNKALVQNILIQNSYFSNQSSSFQYIDIELYFRKYCLKNKFHSKIVQQVKDEQNVCYHQPNFARASAFWKTRYIPSFLAAFYPFFSIIHTYQKSGHPFLFVDLKFVSL